MSNLDIRMSNLTMLFDIFVSNFLTNESTKIPKKHPDWNLQILFFHIYLLYLYPNKEGKVFAKAALLLNCLVYMTDILFCKIVNQALYCQSVFCLGDVSQLLCFCMVESA